MKLISGTDLSQKLKAEMAKEVQDIKDNGGRTPLLTVILVGDNPASQSYVKSKGKACESIGMEHRTLVLDKNISQEELLKVVEEQNADPDVDGILVQLPLPKHIDEDLIIRTIAPDKDVDGFSPINVGRLSIGEKGIVSCTPNGIIELLKRSDISIDGKHCVIIGRSNIVGKPMGMLLLRENGTVTICHSHTKDLKSITKQADILVAAIGKAKFVTSEFVKEGAAVIDVGMDRDENGKLCGDVDFDDVSKVAGALTPVPGGVGPMTIAMLMTNCVDAALLRDSKKQ